MSKPIMSRCRRPLDIISEEGFEENGPRPIGFNRCLLANDSDFLLIAFGDQLSQFFHHVDRFPDGKEAWEMVHSKEPNYYQAIVLDINMPIMDGVQACTKILEYFQRNKLLIDRSNDKQDTWKKVETRPNPFIYALTSESEQLVLDQISKAGFKAVYNMLTDAAIKQILKNAGIEMKPVRYKTG